MFIHFHFSGCKGTQIKANAIAPPLLNFVNQADLVANGAEKDCLGDCLIEMDSMWDTPPTNKPMKGLLFTHLRCFLRRKIQPISVKVITTHSFSHLEICMNEEIRITLQSSKTCIYTK